MALNLEIPNKQEVQLLYVPTEISRYIESENTSWDVASFDYYSGNRYCDLLHIKQTTDWRLVSAGTHFIVCCGDVMVKVGKNDYPNIERREF